MQERINALQNPQLGPKIVQQNALLASWPEPDMLRQVVSRLNQWVGTMSKPGPWMPTQCWRLCRPDTASCRWRPSRS